MHPYYANPFNVPEELVQDPLPEVVLPRPERKFAYRWLDIGCAPKARGAPTLRTSKEAFRICLGGVQFEFHGTDISMPIFEFTPGGEVGHSQYYNPDTEWIKPKTTADGITYYDAAFDMYNIMTDKAFSGEVFDFISVCMTLHHLYDQKKEKTYLRLPFSTLSIVNPSFI